MTYAITNVIAGETTVLKRRSYCDKVPIAVNKRLCWEAHDPRLLRIDSYHPS